MKDHNKQIQRAIYQNAFAVDIIHYDDFLLPPNDFIREKYFAKAHPRRGSRVLEVGIGISSFLCRAVRRYNVDAFAFDYVNASLLAQKNSSCCNLKPCRGDAESLPYKGDSFDMVIAISVIEHLSDFDKAFGEIRRVLKRQGTLILQVPCRDFRFSLFARFKRYESLRHEDWFLRNQNDTGHDYSKIPDRNGWKQAAIRNGFIVSTCDASDICVDSLMMYSFYKLVKRLQSAIIQSRNRHSHSLQESLTQDQCRSTAPNSATYAQESSKHLKTYSLKRRIAGFLWYHIVLKTFWMLLIPERIFRRLPIGASAYLSLRKNHQ